MTDDPSQPNLLVIWHSRTGASEQMARTAACDPAAILMRACDVRSEHLMAASAYLFVCPENLASMSGEMKEMFDRTYYDVLGRIEGRGYATIIAAGSDGEGALRQIDRIATGWRLKRVAEPLIVNFLAETAKEIWAEKTVSEEQFSECRSIGAALCEGIRMGIF